MAKKGGKKPKKGGKKPKKGGKKPKKDGVSFILRRLTGVWVFKFSKVTFPMTISHGRIFFHKRPVALRPSKSKRFPSTAGWRTFRVGTWTYYICISFTGVRLVAFHKGKRIVGRLTKKPKIKAPKKGKKTKKGG